jgi:O-antigen/teichoic acid export membrane protein
VNDQERRQRRLDRARFAISVELLLGLVVAAVTVFAIVATPGCLCPMFYEPPLVERLLPGVALLGLIVGLVSMFRLSRPRAEAGERQWRYHDFMNYEERQRRLDRAHVAIRAELAIGLGVTLLTGFLLIAAPGFSRPMFHEPRLIERLQAAAPLVSLLAWVWMIRLSRPDPEAGERSWRYRDEMA